MTNYYDVGSPTSGIPTSVPVVQLSSVWRSGDDFAAALNRVTRVGGARVIVELPNGFEDTSYPQAYIDGLKQQSYMGFYNDSVCGIGNTSGAAQAKITLKPKSLTSTNLTGTYGSTQRVAGGQIYNRLGRLGSAADQHPIYLFGLTFEGTKQQSISMPTDAGIINAPAIWGGLQPYYAGPGSIMQNLLMRGVGPGSSNTPPWEQGAIIEDRSVNMTIRNCHISGFLSDNTTRVMGSPLMLNASKNIKIENVYMHHGVHSGFTFSYAGSISSSSDVLDGITTKNCKIAHQSNNTSYTNLGNTVGFAGVNHENACGTILHDHLDVQVDNMGLSHPHLTFKNYLQNAAITINEPTWYSSDVHPYLRGMFCVAFPKYYGTSGHTNRQTTPPKVVKNGRTLTPVSLASKPTSMVSSSYTSSTHYALWQW